MTLVIDTPEADALASQLAASTGEPIEQAVMNAIREQLKRVQSDAELSARMRQALAIADRMKARLDAEGIVVPGDDWLYDEHGLPH